MSRFRIPIGPVLALVFGLGWGLAMAMTDDKPLWFWLVAGAFAGVFYALGMTLWMAWKMTDGGRERMRVPKLRDATTVTTAEPLRAVRERIDRQMRELGVTPRFVDEANGFRASGRSWWQSQRIEVAVRSEGAVHQVDIRSEPLWPWQVVDVVGKNEANVERLAGALAPDGPQAARVKAATPVTPPQATRETS